MKTKWPSKEQIILVAAALVASAILLHQFVSGYHIEDGLEFAKARTLHVEDRVDFAAAVKQGSQLVTVEVLDGPFKGEVVEISNLLRGDMQLDTPLKDGDVAIVVLRERGNELQGRIVDFNRQDWLIAFAIGLGGLLILLSGWQGIRMIVALVFNATLILTVLLPLVLRGYNPVWVTASVGVVAAIAMLLLVAGLESKALVAAVGSIAGLAIAGFLGFLGTRLMNLPGVTSGFEQMLYFSGHINLNLRNVFYSSIMIGALGAVVDQSIGVASAQNEVKVRKGDITARELWDSGMTVGRDVMGTMVSAIIMVFVGASMAMMLLFIAQSAPLPRIFNYNFVVSDALFAICSSIGLISATPVTAFVGAMAYSGELRRVLARLQGKPRAVTSETPVES